MEKTKKHKILLVEPDKIGGVYYHRQYVPFKNIELHHPDIEVVRIRPFQNFMAFQVDNPEVFKELSSFSCIYFTRELPGDAKLLVSKFNQNGVLVVMDLDDYWVLPKSHLLYVSYKINGSSMKIVDSLRAVNIVTVSTKQLAKEVIAVRREHDKESVVVINNAIDPTEDQFGVTQREDTGRVRIGWAGGLCHRIDIDQVRYGAYDINRNPEMAGKYQFVLGGFTVAIKANVAASVKEGSPLIEQKDIGLHEQEFFWFERVLTSNHAFLSNYAVSMLCKPGLFLSGNDPIWKNIENRLAQENYRRIWGTTTFEYGRIYDEFDVSMAPLHNDRFNSCKSSLKMLEAGFKGLPIIVSDVNPYKSFLQVHGKECAIAIPYHQINKGWGRAFKSMIESKSMREDYTEALAKVCHEHYHIDKWAKVKADFIRSL